MKLLDKVVENFLQKNEAFFHEHCIQWSAKGDFTIFNYRQDAAPNEYSNVCRALVLDQTGKIRSLLFTRFFNKGQAEAPNLPVQHCDFLEKLDGCLLGVLFDKGKPIAHTRRLISSHQPDLDMEITTFNGKKTSLLKVAEGYLSKIKWWEDDYDCCFAFELIDEATYVVTQYTPERYGLYLIGGRDLTTMKEMSEGELDAIAEEMNSVPGVKVRRPVRWKFDNEQQMQETLLSMPEDFEGFVVRREFSDERLKIKSETYLKRHHMIDTKKSVRGLLPSWLNNEQDEVLAYFPDAAPRFKKIDEAFDKFADMIEWTVRSWQAKVTENQMSKKDLALAIKDAELSFFHGYIFKLYDKHWSDANLKAMLAGKSVKTVEELLFGDENEDSD